MAKPKNYLRVYCLLLLFKYQSCISTPPVIRIRHIDSVRLESLQHFTVDNSVKDTYLMKVEG